MMVTVGNDSNSHHPCSTSQYKVMFQRSDNDCKDPGEESRQGISGPTFQTSGIAWDCHWKPWHTKGYRTNGEELDFGMFTFFMVVRHTSYSERKGLLNSCSVSSICPKKKNWWQFLVILAVWSRRVILAVSFPCWPKLPRSQLVLESLTLLSSNITVRRKSPPNSPNRGFNWKKIYEWKILRCYIWLPEGSYRAPCFLFPEWCFSFLWGHFSRIGFFCPRGVFLFRSVFLVPRNLFFFWSLESVWVLPE